MLAITGAFGKQIDIMDSATGGYKSTYQILKELSQIWDDIDDQGRQSLLYTLGGARQVNVLSAILNNFSLAEETVISAASAAGSAMAENEKYLDSITGKINQLTASLEELATTVLDSDLIKFILDIANGFVKGTNAIIDFVGVIPTLSAALAALLSAHGKQLIGVNAAGSPFLSLFGLLDLINPVNKNSAITEINGFVSAMQQFYNEQLEDEQRSLSGFNLEDKLKQYTALTDANKALVKAQINTGKSFQDNLTILSAYTGSIEKLTVAKKAATLASKTFKAAISAISSALIAFAAQKIIEGIISYFDSLYTTVEEHQEIIAEYTTLLQEANSELDKFHKLQAEGVPLSSNDEARLEFLKDYIASLTEAQRLEQIALDETDLLTNGSWNPFEKDTNQEIRNHLLEQGNIVNRSILTGKAANLKVEMKYSEGLTGEDAQKQTAKIAALSSEVVAGYRELVTLRTDLMKQQELLINAMSRISEDDDNYAKYEHELKNVEATLEATQRDIDNIKKMGVLPTSFVEPEPVMIDNAQSNSWNIFPKYISETVDGVVTDLQTAENAARQLELQLKDVSTTSFDEINKEIDSMQSALSVVTKASEEYAENGAYNLDTLQSLTEIDQRYIDLLIDENGQLSLNTEKIRDLATARVEELRVKIIQGAINQIEALTTEAACLDIITAKQVDSTTALREDTQALLEHTTAQMLSNAEFYNFGDSFKEAAKIIYDRTNAMIQAIDITDLFASSTSKAADAADDLNNALKDRGNLILKALDNRKKPLEDELDAIDEKKEALQDELDALNEIYEAEDREFELQKLKDAYERAKANKTVRLYTHDKGWQWVADPSEVKEAEDAYHEYLREIERDDARKAIQDQIDALDKSKEAIQDQIEAIDNLKEQVQEAMDNIGLTQEEYANNLALLAEFENATYDQLAEKVKAYASDVINSYNSMAQAAHEYNVQAAGTIELPEVIPQAGGSSTLGLGKPPPVPELRYHDGGLVKPQANVSNAFARYIDKLKLGEVPAILQQDEYVLTPNHQQAILDTHKGLINNLNHSKKNISLEIGDIIINNPVGNVSALSDAIIRQLPNQIMKDLYK